MQRRIRADTSTFQRPWTSDRDIFDTEYVDVAIASRTLSYRNRKRAMRLWRQYKMFTSMGHTAMRQSGQHLNMFRNLYDTVKKQLYKLMQYGDLKIHRRRFIRRELIRNADGIADGFASVRAVKRRRAIEKGKLLDLNWDGTTRLRKWISVSRG